MSAPRSSQPFERILIVGCGLIGGSFALASRQVAGVREIVVADRDPEVRRRAVALGLADRAVASPAEAIEGVELVLLAIPVPSMPDVVSELGDRMPNDAVLTDVGSVKSRLSPKIRELLGEKAPCYIGGHPMAGSEDSGIDAADGQLFQGATWLLTPTGDVEPDAFERLSGHLHAIGARVLAVDPERHDRLVAAASHLPQVLASALMAHASRRAEEEGALLAVAAGGFRDVTRVAASDPELWRSILAENRVAVLAEIDGYLEQLASVRDALEAEDWGTVTAFLRAARDARRALPLKQIADTLHDLVIPLPDTPGALAAVTTALGGTGINIEDLSMRHAGDGTRGALVIAIAGDEASQRARAVLEEQGFSSHLEPR